MPSVLKLDTIKSTTGNEAILISEGGVPQLKVPAFRAYASADQAIASNTPTRVNIDTVTGDDYFDTNGWFDTTNKRYTPQIAGYYFFTGTVRATGTNITRYFAALYKNGAQYSFGNITSVSAHSIPVNSIVSSIVYLNGTTDYLELYGSITASSPVFDFNTDTICSTFEGFLVRGT